MANEKLEKDEEKWETEFWSKDSTPWDQGDASPALKYAVEKKYFKGKVLVAGAGWGWDVIYLAAHGYKATGLDISPTCVAKCKEKHGVVKNAEFICHDFFRLPDSDLYDSAFDYTFFCAIDPDMREAWGKSYSNLIKSGGNLVTLMFPILPPRNKLSPNGPPHHAPFEAYEAVLHDFILMKKFEVGEIESSTTTNRSGFEQLAIWKRK